MNKYKITVVSASLKNTYKIEAKTEYLASRKALELFKKISSADCRIVEIKRLKSLTDKILISVAFGLFSAVVVFTALGFGV